MNAMADPEGRSGAVMIRALNWAYDQATTHLPGLGSAEALAESTLKSCGGSPEQAIAKLIRRQVGYAGAAGFVSNIGGILTLPVAIPANLASVLYIQLRTVAAIAPLRGYKTEDPHVRTMAFLCLAGSSATPILEEFAVGIGAKLTTAAIMKISVATLDRINRAVGFRLIAKSGTTGFINLTKFVPVLGGLLAGGFDAALTRGIASVAKKVFTPVTADFLTDVPVSEQSRLDSELDEALDESFPASDPPAIG
jgi:hypothetical protein